MPWDSSSLFSLNTNPYPKSDPTQTQSTPKFQIFFHPNISDPTYNLKGRSFNGFRQSWRRNPSSLLSSSRHLCWTKLIFLIEMSSSSSLRATTTVASTLTLVAPASSELSASSSVATKSVATPLSSPQLRHPSSRASHTRFGSHATKPHCRTSNRDRSRCCCAYSTFFLLFWLVPFWYLFLYVVFTENVMCMCGDGGIGRSWKG